MTVTIVEVAFLVLHVVCALSWAGVALYAYLRTRLVGATLFMVHGVLVAIWIVTTTLFNRFMLPRLHETYQYSFENINLIQGAAYVAHSMLSYGLLIAGLLLLTFGIVRLMRPACPGVAQVGITGDEAQG